MDRSVYINKIASFLPNAPVSNEEIEDYIGLIGGSHQESDPLFSGKMVSKLVTMVWTKSIR